MKERKIRKEWNGKNRRGKWQETIEKEGRQKRELEAKVKSSEDQDRHSPTVALSGEERGDMQRAKMEYTKGQGAESIQRLTDPTST